MAVEVLLLLILLARVVVVTHHVGVLVVVVLTLHLHVLVRHLILPLPGILHLVGVKQVGDGAHAEVLDREVRCLQLWHVLQVSEVRVMIHWVDGDVVHEQVVGSLLLQEICLLLLQYLVLFHWV